MVEGDHVKDNIILNIPHSGTYIPEEHITLFRIDDLSEELRIMTDWYTDELFAFGYTNNVIQNVSRLLVDTERFENDDEEEMAKVGMGAIYTRTSEGKLLKEFDAETRKKILEKYYYPHHFKLEKLTDEALMKYDKALIVDCHSFSSSVLQHEADKTFPRPDICIGTDEYHTPQYLIDTVIRFFEERKYKVKLNSPFKGTIVPLKFYHKETKVMSLMIEINRKLYLDEKTLCKSKDFYKQHSILVMLLHKLHITIIHNT